MIQPVTDALIDALEAQCPEYAVDRARSLPDYEFTHPKAAIVPVLGTVDWGSGPTLANDHRAVRPNVAIHTFTHGLYADPGAYELLADVEAAVEGLAVEGTAAHPGGAMRIQKQMFERAKPGGVTIYVTLVQLSEDD
jgi:hypothetical protein